MENGSKGEQEGVVFDLFKMKQLMKKDALVKFMVNDLVTKGYEEIFALEVVFNSEVLGDTIMEASYTGRNANTVSI